MKDKEVKSKDLETVSGGGKGTVYTRDAYTICLQEVAPEDKLDDFLSLVARELFRRYGKDVSIDELKAAGANDDMFRRPRLNRMAFVNVEFDGDKIALVSVM